MQGKVLIFDPLLQLHMPELWSSFQVAHHFQVKRLTLGKRILLGEANLLSLCRVLYRGGLQFPLQLLYQCITYCFSLLPAHPSAVTYLPICVKGSLIPLAWALLQHLSEMVLPVDGHCLLRPAPIKPVSHLA